MTVRWLGLRFLRNRRTPPSTRAPVATFPLKVQAIIDRQWAEDRVLTGWSRRTYSITADKFMRWVRIWPVEVHW